MTYASGGTIQASDYNTLVSDINLIWGVGSGDYGWGQSTTLSGVSANTTVTATAWSDLISRLNSIRLHESGSGSGIAAPSAGNTITYLSTLQSTITTAGTNRHSNAAGVALAASGSQTGSPTTGGTRSLSRYINFSSANQMRYFFNAGGYFYLDAASSTFSGNTLSNSFDTYSNFAAAVVYAQTGTGGYGFWDLSTGWTTLASYDVGGAYVGSTITLYARLNSSPGAATSIEGRIDWYSPQVSFDDTFSGTAYTTVYAYAPTTTYISNTWGAISSSTGSLT